MLISPDERETQPVPRYDGIVNLDQDEIEVIIGLDPDRVHLRAGDLEIGDWAPEECFIAYLGEGVYSITAENESLRFVPRDAQMFKEGLNHGTGYGLSSAPGPEALERRQGRHARRVEAAAPGVVHGEAPPPKPLTRILFYSLTVATAALGAWAVISIF